MPILNDQQIDRAFDMFGWANGIWKNSIINVPNPKRDSGFDRYAIGEGWGFAEPDLIVLLQGNINNFTLFAGYESETNSELQNVFYRIVGSNGGAESPITTQGIWLSLHRLSWSRAVQLAIQEVYDITCDAQVTEHFVAKWISSVGDIYHSVPENAASPLHNGAYIVGSGEDQKICSGDGDDTIDGGGGKDYLKAGKGDDTYIVDGNDTIYDSDGNGTVYFNGIRLSGGEPESEDAAGGNGGSNKANKKFIGQFGEEYTKSANGLKVTYNGASITIENWEDGDLGFSLEGNGKDEDANEPPDEHGSPLVLDLDGDGIELTDLAQDFVYFDIDNDGIRERTAWVKPDDGLLALDRNGDGLINNANELFGYGETYSAALLGSKLSGPLGLDIRYDSGFDKLALLDDNGDGIIDASDAAYGDLRVWRDLDMDGVSDEGELFTLAESGVTSIDLASTSGSITIEGNYATDFSTYTNADGQQQSIADVWFKFSQVNVLHEKFEIADESILALPSLNANGRVVNLHRSMDLDPHLKAMVETFSANTIADLAKVSAQSEEIILRWHGVDDSKEAAFGRGAYVNGEHLGVLEATSDTPFAQHSGPNPRPYAGAILEDQWDVYFRDVSVRLLLQTDLGQQLFPEMSFEAGAFLLLEEGTTSTTMLERLADNAPVNFFENFAFWHAGLRVLDTVYGSFADVDEETYRANVEGILQAEGIDLDYFGLITAQLGGDGDDGLVTRSVRGNLYYNGHEKYDSVAIGGAGDDEIKLGGEKQIIYWGEGQGNDLVHLSPFMYNGWNFTPRVEIRLKDIDPAELVAERLPENENDLRLTIESTGETLIIVNAFSNAAGLRGSFVMPSGEKIDFRDFLEAIQFQEGHSGTTNTIIATGGEENPTTGTGASELFIGDSGDTFYNFGIGDGEDFIKDLGGQNVLVFGAGIGPDDLVFEALDTDGYSIRISIVGTSDSITIYDQFKENDAAIYEFRFADGQTSLSSEDVIVRTYVASTGDELIIGTSNDDLLDGGAGDDILEGREGGDTYQFGPGYGHDRIQETGIDGIDKIIVDASIADVTMSINGPLLTFELSDGSILEILTPLQQIEEFEFSDITLSSNLMEVYAHNPDSIVMGSSGDDDFPGSSADELLFGGDGSDTYHLQEGSGFDTISDLTDSGSTDTLRIHSNFDQVKLAFVGSDEAFSEVFISLVDGSSVKIIASDGVTSIDRYIFDDREMTADEVIAFIEKDLSHVIGTFNDDNLTGTDNQDDILVGGPGDDLLDGRSGADTYIFNPGDGADTIYDDGYSRSVNGVRSEFDKIIIHGYTPAEVVLSRVEDSNDDLILTLGSSGDSITIEDQLENELPSGLGIMHPAGSYVSSSVGSSEIEEIHFDDGTVWTADDVRAMLVADASTDDDDTINGFDENNEVIEGGRGNDTLDGLGGSDNFIFRPGDGNDTITESVSGDGTDTLRLIGIDPADLVVTKDGNDIVLSFAGSPADSIRLVSQLGTYSFGYNATKVIEQVEFDDGTILSDTNLSDLAFQALATSGSDTINGTKDAESLFLSNGNDTLIGGRGDDVYVRSADVTGDDRIEDDGANSFDTIRLEGVLEGEVSVSSLGDDVVLTLPTGTLTLVNQRDGLGWSVIERIEFGDGSFWNSADITGRIITTSGADALIEGDLLDNTLTGTSVDETLDGKAGDDELSGGNGSDLYLFGRGSGNDRISDNGDDGRISIDRVQLFGLIPDDITLSRVSENEMQIEINDTGEKLILDGQYQGSNKAIEFVEFDDGTIWDNGYLQQNAWWRGTDGDDTVTANQYYTNIVYGGKGDDFLDGGYATTATAPTFIFDVGDGADTLSNLGRDAVIQINGVNASDIHFEVDLINGSADNLLIRYSATDVIEVYRQFYDGYSEYGIQEIRLDDGTVFNATDFAQAISIGTSGDDDMQGGDRDETIDGLAGDDTLEGGGGSDTYLWRAGSGNDTIDEDWGATDLNKVQLVGLNQANVMISRDGYDLLIENTATGEVLTILNQFDRYQVDYAYGVSGIVFEDNTELTREQLERQLPDYEGVIDLYGTSKDDTFVGSISNDRIEAGDGDDIIDGLEGDDEINGDYGNDTYIWRVGSGNDIINDYGDDADIDTLQIEGADFADFEIGRSTEYFSDLRLTHKATGETITLNSQLSSYSSNIERIEFADGTVLEGDTLNVNYPYIGTDNDDYIYTDYGTTDDLLNGRQGDDFLDGGEGSDTYIWQLGDGNDTISEGGGYDLEGSEELPIANPDVNILRLSGIVAADLTFSRDPFDATNLVIAIQQTGETITIEGQFFSEKGTIQKIVFDDASEFSLSNLASTLPIIGTEFDDTLFGGNISDTIEGRESADILVGAGGSDTYLWSMGDGNDDIIDIGLGSDIDILKLRDVLRSEVVFERGTADPAEEEYEPDDEFPPVIGSGDIPTTSDLIVRIVSTDEKIVVRNQFATLADIEYLTRTSGIEQIEFSDGETLTSSQLADLLNDGASTLVDSGDGTLDGGVGDDTLFGGTGDNTYILGSGYDDDLVIDRGGNDKVVFEPGVTPQSIYFSRSQDNPDNLLIEIGGVERSAITVQNQFGNGDARVEAFHFDDGTIISWQQVEQFIIQQSGTSVDDNILGFSGDDNIYGRAGDDKIEGAAGDDAIYGGSGTDLAIFKGNRDDFDVVIEADRVIVTDLTGDLGTDVLYDVEGLIFDNGSSQELVSLVTNTAPIAANGNINGTEDRSITLRDVDIEGFATDGDGDSLQLISVDNAQNGNVAWENGVIKFIPTADFSGIATFDYTVEDTFGETSTATINLTIAAVNDAPIVANLIDEQNGTEDQPFSFLVPENTFSDVDSSDLTISATLADGTDLPDWLSFDATNRTFSGNPPANFNGIIPVLVIASDGVASANTSFAFNLAPVNDAPNAVTPIEDVTIEAGELASVSLPTDAFVDVDGDTLLYSAALSDGSALPDWLSIDPLSGGLTGTPPEGANQTYSIIMTASDETESASNIFDLTIESGNQTPIVSNPILDQSSAEDEVINFTLPVDTFADGDGDTLTLTAALSDGTALPGWLAFDADTRTFSGTPPQDFNGNLNVAVTAFDGELEVSDIFTLEITPVNDAPVVSLPLPDQLSAEDEAVSFALPEDAFNDVDGNELTLAATLVGGMALPTWLSFNAVTQVFAGTPPQDFNGLLNIIVTASDGELEVSDTFALEIMPINDAPVVATPITDQASAEDETINFTLPEDSFSDVDSDPLTLSASLEDGSALPAWLSFNTDTRAFSGTPPTDFNGSLNVTVTASDDELETSDTFTLEITPVNDAPIVSDTLSDQSSNEDEALSFIIPTDAFSDVDDDALALSATLSDSSPIPSWLTFDAANRTFSGTPPQDFNGSLNVTVTAFDGELEASDTFSLEIAPVNDAPIANNDSGFEASSGAEITISANNLLANDSDVDGDNLTIISVTSTSGNGAVGLDIDSNIIYTAAAGFGGEDSFEYTISDGELTSTASVTVSVENNDPHDGWQQGTDGRDWLFGNLLQSNKIYGDGGNDLIFGGLASDQLDGGSGNDQLWGLWGNDTLNGNEGNDRIYGGSGRDTISGGAGNDRLWGESGNDTLNGNEGNDRIYGGAGRDTISGGAGNDRLWGGSGQDNFIFSAGDGRDRIMDYDTGHRWGWFYSAGDRISIDVDDIDSFADLMATASQHRGNVVFDFGNGDELILSHTRLAALDKDAFTFF